MAVNTEQARSLIVSGKTNLEIAAALGIRPNTVPKLKRRLGFRVNGVRRGMGRRKDKTYHEQLRLALKYGGPLPTPKPTKVRRTLGPKLPNNTTPNKQPRAVPRVRPESPEIPISQPVSLALRFSELKRGECHWPTSPHQVAPDQHRFCGHPVSGHRYCAFHEAKGTDRRKTEEVREAWQERQGRAA